MSEREAPVSKQRLNGNLRGLPDGAKVCSVELRKLRYDGERTVRELAVVHVFWPFVAFAQYGSWNVTHAPTGLFVCQEKNLTAAKRKALKLREAADFDFVSPKGRKGVLARRAAEKILPKLRRVG